MFANINVEGFSEHFNDRKFVIGYEGICIALEFDEEKYLPRYLSTYMVGSSNNTDSISTDFYYTVFQIALKSFTQFYAIAANFAQHDIFKFL